MNEDQSLNELESMICQINPVESAVSTGRVMFEAGRIEGTRQQTTRHATSMRLWQLATACSLLIAGSSLLPGLFSIDKDRPVAVIQTGNQFGETQLDETTPPELETELVTLPSRSGQTKLARFLFATTGDSFLSKRQQILRGGIAGLPELQQVSFSPEPVVDNRALMKQLLSEEGWP